MNRESEAKKQGAGKVGGGGGEGGGWRGGSQNAYTWNLIILVVM